MWIKVDDHFDQHPKLQRVGPLGLALWVAGLAYCSRNLTDGFIPWATARTLLSFQFLDPREEPARNGVSDVSTNGLARKVWDVGLGCGMSGMDGSEALEETILMMVAAGLWEPDPDGFRVHDYLDYQLSRDAVTLSRKANAQRQARHRERNSNAVTNGPVTKTKTVEGRRKTESKEDSEASRPPDPASPLALASARLAAGFRPGLIEELTALYPALDVPEIAAKVLEPRKKPIKDFNRSLRNWCKYASTNGIDQKPATEGEWKFR